MNKSDNVTQNWIILRHIKALNKGHGDEEPEKSWKHDGSGQPSCRHPGWKIRSQMVLVVTRIKIVTGGDTCFANTVCLSVTRKYVCMELICPADVNMYDLIVIGDICPPPQK